MATYQFSALSSGQSVAFNPSIDLLNFDQSAIFAANLGVVQEGANSRVTVLSGPDGGKNVLLLNTSPLQLATSNVGFANGSQLLFGDNSVAQNDNLANTLNGTSGNDLLNGFGGADTLNGGLGNDSYIVSAGDVLSDTGGVDTVFSDIDWTLGAGFENLTMTGTGNVQVQANNLDNVLVGNSGNNYFNPRAGNDTILAGAGNDTIDMSTGGTSTPGNKLVDGGAGIDTVDYNGYARSAVFVDLATASATGGGDGGVGRADLLNVERVIGGAFNDRLTGDGAANLFIGNGGDDTLNGAGGNDVLTGGAGADSFLFNQTAGAANADNINDFASGVDKVRLDGSVMTNLGATGNFAAGDARFFSAAGAVAGHDADDRVIYNTTTGQLFYDADGNGAGAAQLIATLQAGAVLAATDIAVGGSGGGEVINGTAGNDSLTGGAGNDTLNGLGGNDTLNGADGADSLSGGAGNDSLSGGPGENFFGDDDADTLDGGLGDDTYEVFQSNDTILADAGGVDTVRAWNIDWTLGAGLENLELLHEFGSGNRGVGTGNELDNLMLGSGDGFESLHGAGGNDTLRGGSMPDALFGDAGNDVLNGGFDNDTLSGGAGADSFIFDGAPDGDLITDFQSGLDKIRLDATAMPALGASGNFGAGDARFFAAAGATGAHDADDRVIYNTSTGQLFYDADGSGAGAAQLIATLQSGAALAATDIAVDNGTTGGGQTINGTAGSDSLVGGAGNDTINGLAGNDTLNGGDGDDSLIGGAGDDSLIGGNGNDTLDISAGGDDTVDGGAGFDTQISLGGGMGAGVEVLLLRNYISGHANGNGNELDNLIRDEGPGGVFLDGNSGNDTLIGGAGNDSFTFSTFFPSPGGGNYGNDSVDGGGVVDWLIFEGNKAVVVDFRAGTASGADGSVSFTNIEAAQGGSFDDRLSGNDSGVQLLGYGGNDILDGGSGNDFLDGDQTHLDHPSTGAGNDLLFGGGGNDTLLGDEGNDTLDGGTGTDSMEGGAGNDFYSVDNAGDVVIEQQNAGIDQVSTALDGYTLSAWVDNLVLVAPAASGTGNAIDNLITGNALNNTLSGLAGNDTLFGSTGSDTLLGGDGDDALHTEFDVSDVLDGGNGNDTLFSQAAAKHTVNLQAGTVTTNAGPGTATLVSIENVVLLNNDDWVLGNAVANRIDTDAGNDTLNGAGGNDTLTGGAGADSFLFTVAPGAANADIVTDFQSGVDKIHLDATVMSALGASGNFASGDARFFAGAGATGGHDADDRVVYNTTTGQLFYDADGNGAGAGQLVATLQSGAALAATDIAVDNGSAPPPPGGATSGDDSLVGGAGNDAINGLAGNDTINGLAGEDTLLGADGNDSLVGGSNVDDLDGGAGNDVLTGGSDAGDAFHFTSAPGAANADVITDFHSTDVLFLDGSVMPELGTPGLFASGDARFFSAAGATGGHDADDRVVYNASTGQLFYDADGAGAGAAQLIATLQGAPALTATNILVSGGSILTGGAGNDSLVGGSTNDLINGLAGNDTLVGNAGNDTLDGGAGIDSMDGGLGNDTYLVTAGDVLTDAGGIDTVKSDASWTLGAAFENLTLIGTAAGTTLTGNNLDNTLIGNDANGSLIGRAGNDTMLGMGGNDTFDMNPGGTASYGNDAIDGGAGTDTVDFGGSSAQSGVVINLGAGTLSGGGASGAGSATLASIENATGSQFADRITGSSADNVISGWIGDDTIDGGAGNDLLDSGSGNDSVNGGAGNDILVGGAGADMFVFNQAPGAANADRITDFASASDKLQLDDSVMAALGAAGNFGSGDVRFFAAAGAGAGHDADDRVVYNTSTGQLYYDADGSGAGAAQLVVTLQSGAVLAATDISVI